MFDDLYDEVSRLWSWSWPAIDGEVTDVAIQHTNDGNSAEKVTLWVSYQFSIGVDGPYTGERIWTSTHYPIKDVVSARHQFRRGQKVRLRYRADDPSVNKFAAPTWRLW